ncbi:hypothetical protein [Pseudomonas syringae group genomosp. 3]|uniref:hypothetical protein n=1 Tax=Pseudomonas syringae group genomosp. 3 TaxID=251701 RepID=UPI0011C37919|nr:hypothetical protein [Pseudomonas syringae group genomosp. 3]
MSPEGNKVYKFFSSGMEFGFRLGVRNHIHFFLQRHEGYSQYGGEVLGRPAHAWSVQDFIKELGTASRSAPGKVDMLIGHVRQWMRYDFETHALRAEFSENGQLWKITLLSV